MRLVTGERSQTAGPDQLPDATKTNMDQSGLPPLLRRPRRLRERNPAPQTGTGRQDLLQDQCVQL